MTTRCALALLSLALAAPLAAQGEADFADAAARELNGYAKACFDGGYPKRAREVWLEVIHEYVTDDATARKALGFLRVGTSWAPDREFRYPTAEKPDAGVARKLEKRWQKVCKKLGGGHRKLAQALAKAGDAAGAERHFDRVLRFLPGDKVAANALETESFEGVQGTAVEIAVLERSRRLERRVAELLEQDYPVQSVSVKSKLLDRAGAKYVVFESEHFRVFGDFDEEVLTSAAKFAERALAFCQDALVGDAEFLWESEGKHVLTFFRGDEVWTAVLQANADCFDAAQLAFILENARITRLQGLGEVMRIAGMGSRAEVEDFAVREVAQVFSGLDTDAVHEGIGHAIVGLFFKRNLIFTVAREEEDGRTSSGADDDDGRFQMPDLSVWKDLAAESAWNRTDVATSKLPLLSAANFSSAARIKAWSICDYCLRRNPALLQRLDETKEIGASNQGAVIRTFEENSGIPLAQLENEWRRFWTQDTPAMRAVRGDKTPLEAVSKIAPGFLDAFNAQRKALFSRVRSDERRSRDVTWVAKYSEPCKDHAEYLKANASERGPAKEHTQDPKKKGFTPAGRSFAERALVATKAKDFREVVAKWVDWPGYRDALVNGGLRSVGIYGVGSIVVMDVSRGIGRRSHSTNFPLDGSRDVPFEVSVAELGPELEAELRRHVKKKKLPKKIGYPLSHHFFSPGALPDPTTMKCTLRRGADEVPGFIHVADGGKVRRTSAPGLVVFYPLEPLARGNEYVQSWEFVTDEGPQTFNVKFTTK